MSFQNSLVNLYFRVSNFKNRKLTPKDIKRSRITEPPKNLVKNTSHEKFTVGDSKGIWLSKENRNRGVLVYLHGGSYRSGPYKEQWEYLVDMCKRTGMAGILIDYKLAPKNPFPQGLNDVIAIISEFSNLGEIGENWFLLGDSAGGGLAVATIFRLNELRANLPKKLILMAGWFDITLENAAIKLNENQDLMLTRRGGKKDAKNYAADADMKNHLLSPIYGDLGSLPPTLIQIGTADMLLWDNRKFYLKCLETGIDVRYEEYKNGFHDFMMVWFLPEAKAARKSQVEFLLF